MNRVITFAFAGGLLLCGPMVVQAAPLGNLAESAATNEAVVTKVHGYHRSCRWGPRRGWWHRHLRSGRPVWCGRRYGYYRPHYYSGFYGPSIYLNFGHRHRFHHHRRH